MGNDEFIVLLQAALDTVNSANNINNKELKRLQNKLNKLQLQAEINPASLTKLVKQIENLTEKKFSIDIDTNVDTNTLKQIKKASDDSANAVIQNEKRKQQAYKATADAVVYHAGVISKLNKAETNGRFYGSSRGTGYFGTGHYFVDAATKHELDTDSSYSKLPYTSVDISKYDNLFKANTDAIASKLHDFLENLTKYTQGSDTFNTSELFEQFEKVFGDTVMDMKEFDTRLDRLKTFMSNSNLDDRSDSVSTQFMKSLGYGGVDTRGTKYADTRYGTVIYDLKEESILQANITDELQKQGQMLEKIDYSKGEVFDKDTDLRIQEQINSLERIKEIKSEFNNIFDSSNLEKSEQELTSAQSRISEIDTIIANCQREIDNADEYVKKFINDMNELGLDVTDEEAVDWGRESQNTFKNRIDELSLERAELEKRIPVLEENYNKELQLAQAAYEQAKKNVEQRHLETQHIDDSAATVIQAEEHKQQAIKETDATYQALAENESIIKSGAGVTTFSGIKEAQEHFRNLLKDEQAIIATTEKFDKNNQLNSFTINVKRASGEVETLKYALDTLKDEDGNITDTFFKLSGSSIGDTGAIKQAQQIENAFSDYTQKIAEFKSTNNQILSGLSIPLGDFETKLNGLKNGTYTITEVTNAFKNLKTEAANITKNFSAQLSSIDRAVRELSVGEQTIAGLKAEIQGLGDAPREINDELVRCTDLLNNVKRIESESGRTEEWSAAYRKWEESLDSIQAKLRTIKKEQPNIASDIQVKNTITRLNNQLAKNSRYSKDAKDKIKAWIDELERGDVAAARLREINTEARTLHSNMSALNKTGLTFFERIKSKLGTLSSYLSASSILATAIGTTRKGISSVYQLDTALVDLRKTAKMTEGQLNDFYFTSNDVAKQMGVTTEQILDQAAAWSRLGYNTAEQATQMAKYSSMFTKISPGMDIDSATDGLVSVMKAFKIGAENVDDVVDGIMSKVNIIGNTRALSNSDIIEFLTRSSAAMAEANNTLDETIALGTAMVEITRDASNAGQVLKTNYCLYVQKCAYRKYLIAGNA